MNRYFKKMQFSEKTKLKVKSKIACGKSIKCYVYCGH